MSKLYYPHWLDVTPAIIKITNGINSDGTDKVEKTISVKGRFNHKTIFTVDSEGRRIALEGKFYIGKDILPNGGKIAGVVVIDEKKYRIYQAKRPRNPDGTICFTKLELI